VRGHERVCAVRRGWREGRKPIGPCRAAGVVFVWQCRVRVCVCVRCDAQQHRRVWVLCWVLLRLGALSPVSVSHRHRRHDNCRRVSWTHWPSLFRPSNVHNWKTICFVVTQQGRYRRAAPRGCAGGSVFQLASRRAVWGWVWGTNARPNVCFVVYLNGCCGRWIRGPSLWSAPNKLLYRAGPDADGRHSGLCSLLYRKFVSGVK
jgi:hypothetical protein